MALALAKLCQNDLSLFGILPNSEGHKSNSYLYNLMIIIILFYFLPSTFRKVGARGGASHPLYARICNRGSWVKGAWNRYALLNSYARSVLPYQCVAPLSPLAPDPPIYPMEAPRLETSGADRPPFLDFMLCPAIPYI